MNEPQRLETQHSGDVTAVRFRDPRITDSLEIEELGRELHQLAAEYSHGKLVLNFSEVEFLSSAVLGKLIRLQGKVKLGGGALNFVESPSALSSLHKIGPIGPFLKNPRGNGPIPWADSRRKQRKSAHESAWKSRGQ
jgi:anti-sigma B factor antagonist